MVTGEKPTRTVLPEAAAIAEELRRVLQGGAWHGPALFELLAGVSGETAARRPVEGAHSIWELVSHLHGDADLVLRRLDGVATEEPPGGDFPWTAAATEEAWRAAVARLREVHDRLLARVARLGEAELAATVPGREHDVRFMLRGSVHHTVYHSGQIAVLKKQARG